MTARIKVVRWCFGEEGRDDSARLIGRLSRRRKAYKCIRILPLLRHLNLDLAFLVTAEDGRSNAPRLAGPRQGC